MTKPTIVLLALLAGCAPLEQAPLIYASRQQFGVNLTAGTPENPGLDVAIGYKGIDAAYVPVAVAKHCPSKSGTECAGAAYHLTPINGNDQQATGTDDDVKIAKLNETIEVQRASQDQAKVALSATKAQLASLTTLVEEVKSLNASLPAAQAAAANPPPPGGPATASTSAAVITETIKAKQAAIADLPSADALAKTIGEQTTNLDSLNQKIASNQQQYDQLVGARQLRSRGQLTDAHSVYGSFTGNSSGTTSGADLSLGKTFSTGIAAQNLSRGIARTVIVAQRTKCVETVAKVAGSGSTPATGNAILAMIGQVCAAASDTAVPTQ